MMNSQKILILSIIFFWGIANASEQLVFTTTERLSMQKRIAIQVLSEAYIKIGYEIKLVYVPEIRAQVSANNDSDIDGVLVNTGGFNKEYSDLIPVPFAIAYLEIFAFAKKNGLQVSDWESLRKYKLACMNASNDAQQLKDRNIYCYGVKEPIQAIKMVASGRADIAILEKNSAIEALIESNIDNIKATGPSLAKSNIYHYYRDLFSISDILILRLVNEGTVYAFQTIVQCLVEHS